MIVSCVYTLYTQAGGFFGFSGMGFLGPNGPGHGFFEETFRCYSMIFFETSKAEEDYGGKSECGGMWCGPSCINHYNLFTVILPSSALERLGKCVYLFNTMSTIIRPLHSILSLLTFMFSFLSSSSFSSLCLPSYNQPVSISATLCCFVSAIRHQLMPNVTPTVACWSSVLTREEYMCHYG